MASRDWPALGAHLIVELLEQEHAAVWPEIEAKIGERPWPGQRSPVNPHHLTTARRTLVDAGVIVQPIPTATRGGRSVPVIHFADTTGRVRDIDRAVRRKRLLHARYRSWADSSTRNPRGLVGPAGERVTHASLVEAARHGYHLLRSDGGEVTSVLGGPVPGGALDSGAYLTTIDKVTDAPRAPVLVPIEVKNRRQTLYTRHAEVHQLLHKAARLQAAHLDQPILPVLVCRRRHYNVWQMAEELGFYVIETFSQPVLAHGVNKRLFEQVRDELGYTDLTLDTGPRSSIVEAFSISVPRDAHLRWPRWAAIGQHLVDEYEILRESTITNRQRTESFERLRDGARSLGCTQAWCQPWAP